MRRTTLGWLVGIGGVAACTQGPPAAKLVAPTPEPWSLPEARPPLDEPLVGALDLATFAFHVSGEVDARPPVGQRGAFGVGNGHAFALLGMTDPLSTWHGIVGPTYEKGDRFFGDVALVPEVDGVVRDYDDEWIARLRGTAVHVTRGNVDDVRVWTLDWAPIAGDGTRAEHRPPVLHRVIIVRNVGSEPVAVRLPLRTVDELVPDGVALVTTRTDGRSLAVVAPGAGWAEDGEGWALDLGTIAPGAAATRVVGLATAMSLDALPAAVAQVPEDAQASLDDTLAWWDADAARGLQLDVDDDVLLDLVDANRVILRVQQSFAGGIAPMSRYTGVWLRDTIGPARALGRLGLHADARAQLDYLELCHSVRGDIGNSCSSGLTPEDRRFEVPWRDLGPFSGRTAAEGPSYLVLSWADHVRWTGDVAALADHWDYLRRALVGQTLTAEGLQPWSGDETFRLAMNVAFGYPVEMPWQDLAWSSNSAMVLIPAARFLAEHAAEVGHPDDAAELGALADRAEQGLVDHFLRPEGHFAALLLRDEGAAQVDLPFEDVNLNLVWAGTYAPADPIARANLDALWDVAGHEDGSVQSAPAPMYLHAGDLSGGASTGMVPGFVLSNLTRGGHPKVHAALDQLLAYASPSGEYAEAILYEDRSVFQPIYDAGGVLSDVSARFRPWEGGIVLDALLEDVVGAEPVVIGGAPALRLRPRVPNGLTHLRAGPIDAPGARVSLDIAWADGWDVAVTCERDVACLVYVEVPLGTWDDVDVTFDGPTHGTLSVRPHGERFAAFVAHEIAPRSTATWRVGAVR